MPQERSILDTDDSGSEFLDSGDVSESEYGSGSLGSPDLIASAEAVEELGEPDDVGLSDYDDLEALDPVFAAEAAQAARCLEGDEHEDVEDLEIDVLDVEGLDPRPQSPTGDQGATSQPIAKGPSTVKKGSSTRGGKQSRKGKGVDMSEVERLLQQFKDKPLVNKQKLFGGNIHPPEYYQNALKNFNVEFYDRKKYAPATLRAIENAAKAWREFCANILKKNWELAYQELDLQSAHMFLNWYLGLRRGPDGRPRKGIRSKRSLLTFWCCFRLSFERHTGHKVDDHLSKRRIFNSLADLGKQHNLTNDPRQNRAVTINQLKDQLEFILRTTEKSYRLGELRILNVLFLLLLAPAGARPESILKLRFGDIRVVLARDPHGGPHVLLLKFTLNFTKQYLDKKPTKTFTIPEMIFDPSLLLSPHVFLLGILFRHRAFRSEPLNDSPDKLSTIDIFKGEDELLLPLKEELRDVCVFRRAKETLTGFEISQEPLSYGIIRGWVKRIGELMGYEYTTIPYTLRYMAGNALDRDVNVSESVRNLSLDHAPHSNTFQKHYLARNISIDLWAIQRGTDPQKELLLQSTSHGHSRSSRRPINLTPEQNLAVNQHPDVLALQKQIGKVVRGSAASRRLRLEVKSTKAQIARALKRDSREEWTKDQADDDIAEQLQSNGPAKKKTTARQAATRPMAPAQMRMVEALTAPLKSTDLRDQFTRRDQAIAAIVGYCDANEPLLTRVLQAREPGRPPEFQRTVPATSASSASSAPAEAAQAAQTAADLLRASVMVEHPGQRLTRCFACIGKALTIDADNPEIDSLCRHHYSSAGLSRHFRSVHLARMGEEPKTICPVCTPAVKLRTKMSVQVHAEDVHGIKTEFRQY